MVPHRRVRLRQTTATRQLQTRTRTAASRSCPASAPYTLAQCTLLCAVRKSYNAHMLGAICRPEPASQAVVPVVTDAEALAKVAEDDEMMADVLKVHAPTKGCHRMCTST